MRHRVKGRKLGRTASHRKATLQALAIALIHERKIQTTVAKAKELRTFVEPLITRAKEDTMHNRREVFSRLQDKYAVTELFQEVGPKAKDRPGGYTRVVKLGFRVGDAAEMALIELVDYNDVAPEERQGGKKRTRRAGRAKAAAAPSAEAAGEAESKSAETSEPSQEPAKAVEEASASSEQADASEGSASSADFTVDQVKEKLESMSREEAVSFVGEDERVTVQKALAKHLESLEKDQNND